MDKKTSSVIGICILAGLHLASVIEAIADSICTECISIRLGRPLIVRGPAPDEMDTPFNEIKLASGFYRGFSSNATSYAIDGTNPWNMGNARQPVLSPGEAGSINSCGQWLNDTEQVTGGVHGFIHNEMSCNYALSQTHKSMSYAWSSDEGLTWTAAGAIISGMDAPTPGRITGEGDCTVIDGKDGYFYAYCLRASDWRTIVARASSTTLGPGNWVKYFNGGWSQPGLGGNALSLGFIGTTVGRWSENDNILLLGVDKWFGGLKASFSSDRIQFTTLQEPLLPLEDENWVRPAPTELIAYPSVINSTDVNNQIGNEFILSYTYLQPGEAFDKRYLVFRDVRMNIAPSPVSVQVGIALTRWHNTTTKDRWTTTAPVPGSYNDYAYDKHLGFLMTKPHQVLPSVKLEDCVSYWPGHPDHLLTNDGMCAAGGYTRLRTAGWLLRDSSPNTLPVYRCYNPTEMSHFASNHADCEGIGSAEWLLGYALDDTVDFTPPVITIDGSPPPLSKSASGNFAFSSNEQSYFTCRLDSANFTPCTIPYVYSGLAEGSHTFTVQAVDLSGNTGSASYNWTIDTIPPDTVIDSKPSDPSPSTSGSFILSSESGSTFECSFDGAPYSACSNPVNFSNFLNGVHSFAARTTDAAGNVDPIPAAYSWLISVPVKLSSAGQPNSYYATLADALASFVSGAPALIVTLQFDFIESVKVDRCGETITLGPAYEPTFSTVIGLSAINGSLTITCGIVYIDGVVVK